MEMILHLRGTDMKTYCFSTPIFQNIQNFADTHPHNVLLFKGPAGTGKTTSAESLSDEINAIRDKHSTDSLIKSDPERSYEEIRKLYENAAQIASENQVVVIIIDEIDRLTKSDGQNALPEGSRSVLRELCYQLDLHKNNPYILTIMTTNTKNPIDESLSSRSNIIMWELPDIEKRYEIIKYYLEKNKIIGLDAVSIDILAKESVNFSGRHLEFVIANVANKVKKHENITKETIVENIKQEINLVRTKNGIPGERYWYTDIIENCPSGKKLLITTATGTIGVVVGVVYKKIADEIVKNPEIQKKIMEISQKISGKAGAVLKYFSKNNPNPSPNPLVIAKTT